MPEQRAALRLFARWCAQASACIFRCAPVASSRSVLCNRERSFLLQNKEPHCGSLRAGARKRQLAFSDAHQSHPRGAFCVIGNEVSYYTKKFPPPGTAQGGKKCSNNSLSKDLFRNVRSGLCVLRIIVRADPLRVIRRKDRAADHDPAVDIILPEKPDGLFHRTQSRRHEG